MDFYAHSFPNEPEKAHWETLPQHEQRVADLCREFLVRIDPSLACWGEILGRWHDLGKYSNEFQRYLCRATAQSDDVHTSEVSGRVDHSTAAAKLAVEMRPDYGKVLAYMFAGHHAGLPDWDIGHGQAGLKQRLAKDIPDWKRYAPQTLVELPVPRLPSFTRPDPTDLKNRHAIGAFRVAFWVRMMFSGLVDADFVATESFMAPDRAQLRPRIETSMASLGEHLERVLSERHANPEPTTVNQIRAEVSNACAKAATLPPGLFSLNVPTGGGKTLASLRFAMTHAAATGLNGVIVAIPFTSIIEQNAKVYRELFSTLSDQIVLEHHSNLDPKTETTTNRLQAENWDAPIVVTTNVQLFESLFACRTSRCRKLHRIARRVIILDEVQTLPVELLKPSLFAIRELVESFGCSVVLCTATQPALNWRDDFAIGLKNIRPIIEDPNTLYRRLKRTNAEFIGKLDNDDLISRIESEPQVLCIVNTRPNAAELYEGLSDRSGNFHLSTRMCAAHRLHVLENRIRPRLDAGKSCRVISTQLIEAGVDVDFPVVYRAICGLDSLTQAAGRCNREGRLECGLVYFFEGEKLPPPGMLRQAADSGRELIAEYEDLLSPEAVEAYFQLHFWKKSDSWDKHDVLEAIGKQPDRMQFNYRQIADRYRFIREQTESVLIPWGKKSRPMFKKLDNPHAVLGRDDWRSLQRYAVSVRDHEMLQLKHAGALEMKHDRWVLSQTHLYDEALGLRVQQANGVLPADDLIC